MRPQLLILVIVEKHNKSLSSVVIPSGGVRSPQPVCAVQLQRCGEELRPENLCKELCHELDRVRAFPPSSGWIFVNDSPNHHLVNQNCFQRGIFTLQHNNSVAIVGQISFHIGNAPGM